MAKLYLVFCVALLGLLQAGIAFRSGILWHINRIFIDKQAISNGYRRCATPLKMGLFNSFKKLVSGSSLMERLAAENEATLKLYQQRVARINYIEGTVQHLPDSELQGKTAAFRARLKQGETLDSLLEEAFAIVRDASWRVLQLRHFDVQLIAGMAMHEGRLTEMKTGEGKTLAAVLPVYLRSLAGEGAFVVTTNDYLARRDAGNVGQVLRFLGLSVGVLQAQQSTVQRQEAYSCDVTYVSQQELGLDFLRDNLVLTLDAIVQRRPYNFCLVDDAESILIDEARTPLIISRPGSSPKSKENVNISAETQTIAKTTYQSLFRLFPNLCGMTGIALTDAAELCDTYDLKVFPVPTHLPVKRTDYPDAVFRSQAGRMKALIRDVQSNHENGRPVLIGTTSVEASAELVAALRDLDISVQLLNARPKNVEQESAIIAQAGRLGAVTVATNMAGCGTDIVLGGSSREIARALVKRLLLVRTGLASSISQSPLRLSSPVDDSDLALASFISDRPLSLKEIAQGIELWMPVQPSPAAEQALQQAVHSCATQSMSSMNTNASCSGTAADRVQMSLLIEGMVAQACDTTLNTAASVLPIVSGDLISAINTLRTALDTVIAEFDTVVRRDREEVKRLGGLYVIGTARHNSRRIGSQLRDRAGRQGDPGSSRFYLSLEDDVFRVFGAKKIAGLLKSFRGGEDVPIENKVVTMALDKVKRRLEDQFRDERQQVRQLDEVASHQRSVVYTQRRAFLTSSDSGILTVLSRYSLQTVDEILAEAISATAAAVAKDKSLIPKGLLVQADRLCEKVCEFFPSLQLSAQEVAAVATSQVLLRKLLHGRLEQAITLKVAQLAAQSPTAGSSADDRSSTSRVSGASLSQHWTAAGFFRSQVIAQLDEAWFQQLARLDLLEEEMLLQSYTLGKNVMEAYREKAMLLFSTLLDDVRRNAVYSIFMFDPAPRPT